MQKRDLVIILSAFFLLAGIVTYAISAEFPVPIEKKIIHSTPPSEFAGKKNPFTSLITANKTGVYDTEAKMHYQAITERGGELYRANCLPCHGEKSNGRGPQAAGFYPPPADFTNPETIGALKENYLLWRVREGGREEPFKSAMPAFGDDLTEEEIWSIIMYEYKNAGARPKS